MQEQWTTYREGSECYSNCEDVPSAAPTILSCNVDPKYKGDGKCHKKPKRFLNSEICEWDGGDCCEETCLANPDPAAVAKCGSKGYDCQDPDVCSFDAKYKGDGKCHKKPRRFLNSEACD